MSKLFDLDRIDAALKRAARTATTGANGERSGRFAPRGTPAPVEAPPPKAKQP